MHRGFLSILLHYHYNSSTVTKCILYVYNHHVRKPAPKLCKLLFHNSIRRMSRLFTGLTSFFPGKIGFPCKSSANMQPTDHISTAGPYFVAPRSNSGGLLKITRSFIHEKQGPHQDVMHLAHTHTKSLAI